jgi:DNA polymerase (family 10)
VSANADIARLFGEMADALELLGENAFRVNALRKVARTAEDAAEDLALLARADVKTLEAIPGIGASSARKIVEFATTGGMHEHAELLAKLPAGLMAVLRVPGLGPKTVKLLWEQGGVTDLATLKSKLESGALEGLPRMGAKTLQNIRENLAFLETAGARTRLGDALPVAEALVAALAALPGVSEAAFAGSLRRGKETIGDIDLLVATKSPRPVMEAFTSRPDVAKVLAHGETKSSVRLKSGLQVDLRAVDPAAWGAALLYFTGSKEHNVLLRERAQQRGMRLNEYGLFPDDGNPEPPQDRGVKPAAAKTEQAIYKALDVPFLPPELREARQELAAPPAGLIEITDIRRELHCHTTASDGFCSIEEMIGEAKRRGFDCIAITDHSRSSAQANGLSVERLLEHAEAVHAAGKRVGGIHALAGSEVDILADGRLDYPDEVLAQLDWVVASPHTALKQEPTAATARLLAAITNPFVHVIGHPSGRMLGGRPGLEPDWAALFKAAAKAQVAMEINANPHRLDLRDQLVHAALAAGCAIAINTDAHALDNLDLLRFGVLTGRRGGLTAERCVNAWPWKRFDAWRASRGR